MTKPIFHPSEDKIDRVGGCIACALVAISGMLGVVSLILEVMKLARR